MGLTISRALCELLHCRLELKSEPGHGSTFSIHFQPPVSVAPKPKKKLNGDTTFLPRLQRGKNSDRERLNPGRLVLVIDDEADSRALLRHMLEELGCRVLTADGGNRALSEARRHKPDLILLDLMMPTMDGWQVLQSLKADVELTHIPVVITSIVVEENRGSIIGAVDLLQKPILREDLQRVIGKQLRPRVLVVEDNHSDQCIFANGLAAEGIEFRVANSGRDALLVLDQFNPDVVLLDILLPEMDGMEFLHHLRRNPRLERLPVFIVTAKELAPPNWWRYSGRPISSSESPGIWRRISRASWRARCFRRSSNPAHLRTRPRPPPHESHPRF